MVGFSPLHPDVPALQFVFVVMELCANGELFDLLVKSTLSEESAAQMFFDMVNAVRDRARASSCRYSIMQYRPHRALHDKKRKSGGVSNIHVRSVPDGMCGARADKG